MIHLMDYSLHIKQQFLALITNIKYGNDTKNNSLVDCCLTSDEKYSSIFMVKTSIKQNFLCTLFHVNLTFKICYLTYHIPIPYRFALNIK